MLKIILSIFSLLLGSSLLLFGVGLQGTLVSLRAGLEGFSIETTGVVMSAYFIGYGIGSYLCPRLVRRVGHIRTYSVLATIASAAAVAYLLEPTPLFWFFLRIVTGICIVGLFMVIESWLNALASNTLRGQFFAVYMITTLLAMAAGQYLLLLGEVAGFELFAITTVLISLALVPIAMTRVPQPEVIETRRIGLRQLFRDSPLGTVGTLAAGLNNGAFWGLAAVFASGAGLDKVGIANFISITVVGGALLQLPIGRLSDRVDRRKVLTVAAVLAALLALLCYYLSYISTPLLLASAFLYGGFSFSIYSLSVAHLNDRVGPEGALEAARGLLLLYGVGAAIGPILAGMVMERNSYHDLLAFFAAVHLLLGGYALYRLIVGEALPVEEQGEFAPLSRTSPVAFELDPRLEEGSPMEEKPAEENPVPNETAKTE